ncbi:MAG TPA: TetR/AcrR family transcriptional regulator [Steroidobacteraceae bacterium]|nr:TetR/AcrR family transcriptional regulator [Steroidobacteraceae bacterium]
MSYTAERRQEEKDRRRHEIVDAAEQLYAELGWDGVTMDQVARRARLSRALLYVYFRDKADLHFAIVERALETLRLRFEQASVRPGSGLDRVEAMGRAYVAFALELPHYFDACSRFEAHQPGTDACAPNESACIAAGHRVHETIATTLLAGVADGSIRDDIGDPYLNALSLWGFTHGIIQIATTKSYQLAHEGIAVPQLLDHSFGMLRSSLARRG